MLQIALLFEKAISGTVRYTIAGRKCPLPREQTGFTPGAPEIHLRSKKDRISGRWGLPAQRNLVRANGN
jgi:hypothetical protein